MSWKIAYSGKARQDLRSIYEYIANELCVPDTAAKQARRILQNIKSLSEMPLRYRLYVDEPWHSMGLRFFPVDNYLVFYLPKETDKIVYIVRIMYGGRDIGKQLSETIEY
jgi:toxin ParE1/3/4